jgi:hypothetical protein
MRTNVLKPNSSFKMQEAPPRQASINSIGKNGNLTLLLYSNHVRHIHLYTYLRCIWLWVWISGTGDWRTDSRAYFNLLQHSSLSFLISPNGVRRYCVKMGSKAVHFEMWVRVKDFKNQWQRVARTMTWKFQSITMQHHNLSLLIKIFDS